MDKNKRLFPLRKHPVGGILKGKGKNFRKGMGILLAAALLFNTLPSSQLTAAASEFSRTGLCEHHRSHTEDCGYQEGAQCSHTHTEECYTTVTDCVHTHTEECMASDTEDLEQCTYDCRICPIEERIAGLPGEVTEDNADDVRAQLDEILALYAELAEEEQEQIDISRCEELQGALDAANAPVPAAEKASGDFGKDSALHWLLDENGALTISGTGDMPNFSVNSMPWKDYKSIITSVKIENGVLSIGASAFEDCTGLTRVEIPNSVTSIGNSAFYTCSGLSQVEIPNSVTSIGYSAFYDCSSLEMVHIPDSVTTIGYRAFLSCTSLTSVTIPDSVTTIGSGAFSGCSGLTSVTIGSGVTTIGEAVFSNCTGLTSVTIGSSVTTIGERAFDTCRCLASVTIPDSVETIGEEAFNTCTGLKTVTIPDSVTTIGKYAFYNCESLTSVTIPGSVKAIGDGAFRYCDVLTQVIFKGKTAPTLGGGNVFADTSGDLKIFVFAGATGYTGEGWPQSVASIVAMVKKESGESIYVTTLADAFAAKNNGAAVMLLADVETAEIISATENNVTLDLNGHTYQSSNATGAFQLEDQTNLSVTDSRGSGQVIATNGSCFMIKGGQLQINGGTFIGKTYAIHCSHPTWPTVKLSGGAFSGESGAICSEFNRTLRDMLVQEPHYAFFQNSQPVALEDGQKALSAGAYTVAECSKHSYVYDHTPEEATHSMACRYCGFEAAGPCTFTNGRCDCGAELAVALTDPAEVEPYTGTEQEPQVTVTVDGQVLNANHYRVSYANNINAGEATVTVTGSFAGMATTTFTIAPASLTIKANDQTISYGQNIAEGAAQVSNDTLCGGDTLQSITLTASSDQVSVENKSITPSAAQIKNRSGEDVTANYEITYQTGTLTINKSTPTIAFASGYDPGKSYDGQRIADPTAGNLVITGAPFKDVLFKWSATPLNAGTYTLTAIIPDTDNTAEAEATLDVTIAPKEVAADSSNITLTPAEYEYNGTERRPAVAIRDGNVTIPAEEYIVYYSDNIKVGTAQVTISDNRGGNYAVNGTTTFRIKKPGLGNATVTLTGISFTYDGTAQTPATDQVTVTLDGKVIPSDQYAISATDNTNAGTATVSVTATADGNYSGSASGEFTIAQAPLTITANDQTITYGESIAEGTAQVSAGTFCGGDTLQGITLTPSTADVPGGTITPSAAQIKNSSGEDVTANYQITYQTGTLTIHKAAGTLTVPGTELAKTFGDGQFSLSCFTNGDGKISYASSNEGAASVSEDGTVLIKGAGETTVTVSLGEGTNHTGGAEQKIRLTVAKADAPAIITETRNYTDTNGSGGTVTIDVAGKLPKNRGKTEYTCATTDAEGILSGVSVDDKGNLSYTVQGNKKTGDTASITVTAEMANYKTAAFTVNIVLVERKTVEPQAGSSVSTDGSSTLVYGQRLSELKLADVAFVEQGTERIVPGSLTWKNPDAVPNAADRMAEWIFMPEDGGEYAELTGTVPITVAKATPDVENPVAEAVTYHPSKTLDSVKLTGGSATWTVSGSAVTVRGAWNWQSADTVPVVNNSGYAAVFTPEDTANYETVTRTVTVQVAKAAPYIAVPPAAAGTTCGDSLDISALTGGTAQYSEDDSTAVPGSFAWKDGFIKPAVSDSGVTGYTVVFQPADGINYSSMETVATLTVERKENAPNMPPDAMNVANKYEKAGDVPLPEGWEWKETDRETALEVNMPVTAVAVYTAADKDNYKKTEVTVAVTRSSCGHTAGDILYTGAGEKAPTCTENGLGHRECTKCGAVTESGIVVTAPGHTGGTATCISGKVCTVCGTEYGAKDSQAHTHKEVRGQKAATCTVDGYTGDEFCTGCGAKTGSGTVISATGHDWHVTREEAATAASEGKRYYTCSRCGQTREETISKLPSDEEKKILSLENAKVSGIKSQYTYKSKGCRPLPKVYYGNKLLQRGVDYTLVFESNKKVGLAAIIIKGKGNYTNYKKINFKIVPKGTSLVKLKRQSKKIIVKWKKQTKQVTGYEIQYSANKHFSSGKERIIRVKKPFAASVTIKQKKREKIYIRIRTYKKASGKKYYSSWSKAACVR